MAVINFHDQIDRVDSYDDTPEGRGSLTLYSGRTSVTIYSTNAQRQSLLNALFDAVMHPGKTIYLGECCEHGIPVERYCGECNTEAAEARADAMEDR